MSEIKHMKTGSIKIDVSDDKKLVSIAVTCEPEACCMECLQNMIMRLMNRVQSKEQTTGLH